MQPVLSARAQREADRLTIRQFGLPGRVLMETAGRAAAYHIGRALKPTVKGKRVHVLAGRGNNGGDGYVVARVLHAEGARVCVWEDGSGAELASETAQQRRLLAAIAAHTREESLALRPLDNVMQSRADLYVDALLGTGLTRTIRGRLAQAVRFINAQSVPVVALDIPTGLHADTGEPLGRAVKADFTITMGALKPGHLLRQGPELAGRTIVADIGIPSHVVRDVQQTYGSSWRTTDAGVRALLPDRAHDAHKYSVGMVLVVAGSPGLTGAAVMASKAATRVGAGYVMCATHASAQPVIASHLKTVTTAALPEKGPGELFSRAAEARLEEPLKKARALLVGPGLGRSEGTQGFVETLLERTTLPAVIDADGLNCLAGLDQEIARLSRGRWILTPHGGELSRLAAGETLENRIAAVRHLAGRWKVVLIAKGLPSVVGTPYGDVYICGSGNTALATAGTGDILAGLCGGLLAQGLSPAAAAVAGVHLGGRCAEYYASSRAPASMVATDMLTALPHVLKAIGSAPAPNAR